MKTIILGGIVCVLASGWVFAASLEDTAASGKRILASEFPKTASRAIFFESRMNSKDPSVRVRVLIEVGYFYRLPDAEYVRFLKRMYRDPDRLVRGSAIKKLHEMWVPLDPKDLPLVFTGYNNRQVIDRRSKTVVRELIEQCLGEGAEAGYAAHALGLLRVKEAIPALIRLGKDANIFARYAAARALFHCGDRSSAVALLDAMSSRQLVIYALANRDGAKSARRSGASPWYAACACRALIAAGGKEKRLGLKRLVELMGFLERSEDVNDRSKIHWVRALLAEMSGEYFTSSKEASEWMKRDTERKVVTRELTAKQRGIADALVAKPIQTIRSKLAKEADLLARNIKKLSERKKEWGGREAAMRIARYAKRCRESDVPVPEEINEKVVDDIIWQYENAYGKKNDLKNHREECARALGFIGAPKGIPTILKSIKQNGGHFSWQALDGPVTDQRFIAAIEEHLDFTCQQDAFPAITYLARIGPASIPTLRRFLEGQDIALRREAASALVKIGTPECLPLLEKLRKDENRKLATKAEAGILKIRCRAIDKIYSPPSWVPEDNARLVHLTRLALYDDDAKVRSQAAASLIKLGESGVWHLRRHLPDRSHGSGPGGPYFFVTERASDLLVRIGKPAIPALIDALCDEYQHGRDFAAKALQKITGETFGPEYDRWKTWYLLKH